MEGFIATLSRFIACCGKLTVICSDHGTNFVGAARELKELYHFLNNSKTRNASYTCNTCRSDVFDL